MNTKKKKESLDCDLADQTKMCFAEVLENEIDVRLTLPCKVLFQILLAHNNCVVVGL